MGDNWIPTMRSTKHGAQAAIVRASLDTDGLVPDSKRPSVTAIRFQLAHFGDDGLGDQAEVAAIDDAFDAIEADLASDAAALHVARVRGKGRCKVLVYAPAASRQAIERIVRRAMPDHRPSFEHADDPSWKAYRALLPTAAERVCEKSDYPGLSWWSMRLIMARRIMDSLLAVVSS